MNSYIRPTSDIFIKYLFGTEQNKDLLLSFINAVLKDSDFPQVSKVTLKNPFSYSNFVMDKESILDISAEDDKGRLYDIEIQSFGNSEFIKRSLYYWARMYSSQLEKGGDYTRLRPAISINILSFSLFEKLDSVHSCFLLHEKDNHDFVLTDHLEIHFLELEKMADKELAGELKRWIEYFKNEGKGDDMTYLLSDSTLQKAHEVYKEFVSDPELRSLYESREKWRKDYNTDIKLSREEGVLEGKLETARALLKGGMSAEEVSGYTGLPIEKIKDLNQQ